MHFQLDNASDRPVYQQIIDQIKRAIALAHLKKDQKLPTVRQLAQQLVINPNTIAKAYRQLERENIIITKPGAGTFIAQINTTLSTAVRKKLITRQFELLVVDAVHMQIDKKTLTQWFSQTIDRFKLT